MTKGLHETRKADCMSLDIKANERKKIYTKQTDETKQTFHRKNCILHLQRHINPTTSNNNNKINEEDKPRKYEANTHKQITRKNINNATKVNRTGQV